MPRSVFTDAYSVLIATLVEARKDTGMTQVELSNRLKRPQSFISKIEQGQRRLDVIEFCAIARALGRDPVALFDTVYRKLPGELNV